MKLGWCAPLEGASRVAAAGYDFLEAHLAPMNLEDDLAFAAALTASRRATFPTTVYNQLLPRSMMVVGPDVNRNRVVNYLKRATEVMSARRAEIVVFGSGWARNVPPGWSHEDATAQFIEMASWCTDAFAGTGIVLALEAQNTTETNFMTTFPQSVALAKRINHPSVKVISDMYHLYMEAEPLSVIKDSIDWIVHVHLSGSERRLPSEGAYDVDSYLKVLRSADYRGTLSIEMFEDVPLETMRSTAEWVRERWRVAAS